MRTALAAFALGERVADQVVGDAVEQRARQARVRRRLRPANSTPSPRYWRESDSHQAWAATSVSPASLRPLQLFEGLGEALRDHRQLAAYQRLQLAANRALSSRAAAEHSTFSDCSRFLMSCVMRAPVSCTACR